MSSSEEIQEVFESDIRRMTDKVVNGFGPLSLYDGAHDLGEIHSVLPEAFVELCAEVEKADWDHAPAASAAQEGSR